MGVTGTFVSISMCAICKFAARAPCKARGKCTWTANGRRVAAATVGARLGATSYSVHSWALRRVPCFGGADCDLTATSGFATSPATHVDRRRLSLLESRLKKRGGAMAVISLSGRMNSHELT